MKTSLNEEKVSCYKIWEWSTSKCSNPVEFQNKINDKPLEVTNHEKDLGVYVSSDLT